MTASEYRYLQAIERLQRENGKVIMSDIAQKLAFARASVYKKLLSLEQQGYVVKEDGKYVALTRKGKSEFDSTGRFAEICCDILAQHTGLEKRLLSHDAVSMACALSSRCRTALVADKN